MFSLAVVNPDLELLFFSPLFSGRADPCAVCEDNTSTPMEIASGINRSDICELLQVEETIFSTQVSKNSKL